MSGDDLELTEGRILQVINVSSLCHLMAI